MKISTLYFPLLFFVFAAVAQEKDTTHQLLEVVVTATRNSTPVTKLPYTVNTVSRKQMDEVQNRTTPEMLTAVTGVFVQKTNHAGGSPFLRGLTGNQSLIMVDGIRLNNATTRFGPNQYLNTIDVYTLEKIEVVKGSGSVQYGSDALGGVLQVFTKDPVFGKRSIHGKALFRAVSQDMEYTGRGELEYRSQRFALLAGYTNRSFGDLVGGGSTGKQSPSGYKEQAYDVKLKWQPTASLTFTAAHQYLQQKEVPLYHRVKLENFAYYFFDPQQRQLSYLHTDLHLTGRWVNNIRLILSHQQTVEKRSYQRNGNQNRFLEADNVNTAGITLDISSAINHVWTINSGAEYYSDGVNSSKQQVNIATNSIQQQRGLYPDKARSANFSLYALHHFRYRKLNIEAGLRYNSLAITIPDTTTSALKLGSVTIRPSSLVFNGAALYSVGKHHSVFGSFSSGYRAPNIDDMGTLGLVDFRYEIPAYALEPEKTMHSEMGYRFNGSKVQAGASLFYMHLSNLITRVQVPGRQVGGYNVYTKENSQQSFIRGAEASVSWQISSSLRANTGVAYTYGQNLSRKEPMRRIPPFNGRFQLRYQKGLWHVMMDQFFATKQARLAQGDKDDNRIPAGGTPDWYAVNISTGYTAEPLSVRLGMQNLFNRDYRIHGSGINNTGRSVWTAVHFNF